MKPNKAEKVRREWLEELRVVLHVYHTLQYARREGETIYSADRYEILEARIQLLEAMNTDGS